MRALLFGLVALALGGCSAAAPRYTDESRELTAQAARHAAPHHVFAGDITNGHNPSYQGGDRPDPLH